MQKEGRGVKRMMDDFEQPTEVPVLPSFFRALLLLLNFPRDKVGESDGKFSSIFQRRLDIYLFQFPQAEENVFRPLNILFHLGGFFFCSKSWLVQEKRPPSLPPVSTPQIPAERKGGKKGRWREGGNSGRRGRGRFVRLSSSGRRRRRGTLAYTQKVPPSSLSTDEWASAKEWEGKERTKKSLRLSLSQLSFCLWALQQKVLYYYY